MSLPRQPRPRQVIFHIKNVDEQEMVAYEPPPAAVPATVTPQQSKPSVPERKQVQIRGPSTSPTLTEVPTKLPSPSFSSSMIASETAISSSSTSETISHSSFSQSASSTSAASAEPATRAISSSSSVIASSSSVVSQAYRPSSSLISPIPDSPSYYVPPPLALCDTASFQQSYVCEKLTACYLRTQTDSNNRNKKNPIILSLPLMHSFYDVQIWNTQGRMKVNATFTNSLASGQNGVEAALLIPNTLGRLTHSTLRIIKTHSEQAASGEEGGKKRTTAAPSLIVNLGSHVPQVVRQYETVLVEKEKVNWQNVKSGKDVVENKKQQPQQESMDDNHSNSNISYTGILSFLSATPKSSYTLIPIPHHLQHAESLSIELEFLLEACYNPLTKQYALEVPTRYEETEIGMLVNPVKQESTISPPPPSRYTQSLTSILSYSIHLHISNTSDPVVSKFQIGSNTHGVQTKMLMNSSHPAGGGQLQMNTTSTYTTYYIQIGAPRSDIDEDEEDDGKKKNKDKKQIPSATPTSLSILYTLPLTTSLQVIALRDINIPAWDHQQKQLVDPWVESGSFMIQLIPPQIKAWMGEGIGREMEEEEKKNDGLEMKDIRFASSSSSSSSLTTKVNFTPTIHPRTLLLFVDITHGRNMVTDHAFEEIIMCLRGDESLEENKWDWIQVVRYSSGGKGSNPSSSAACVQRFSVEPAVPCTRLNKSAILTWFNRYTELDVASSDSSSSSFSGTFVSSTPALKYALNKLWSVIHSITTSEACKHTQVCVYWIVNGGGGWSSLQLSAAEKQVEEQERAEIQVQIARALEEISSSSSSSTQFTRPRILTLSINSSFSTLSLLRYTSLLTGSGETLCLAAFTPRDESYPLILKQLEAYAGLTIRRNQAETPSTSMCLRGVEVGVRSRMEGRMQEERKQVASSLEESVLDEESFQIYPSSHSLSDLTFGQLLTIVGTYKYDTRRANDASTQQNNNKPTTFPRYIYLSGTLPSGRFYEQRVEVQYNFTIPIQKLTALRTMEYRYLSKMQAGQYEVSSPFFSAAAAKYHRAWLNEFSLKSGLELHGMTKRVVVEVGKDGEKIPIAGVSSSSSSSASASSEQLLVAQRNYNHYLQQRQAQYVAAIRQQQQWRREDGGEGGNSSASSSSSSSSSSTQPPQPLYKKPSNTTLCYSSSSTEAALISAQADLLYNMMYWPAQQTSGEQQGSQSLSARAEASSRYGVGSAALSDMVLWEVQAPVATLHLFVTGIVYLSSSTGLDGAGSGGVHHLFEQSHLGCCFCCNCGGGGCGCLDLLFVCFH